MKFLKHGRDQFAHLGKQLLGGSRHMVDFHVGDDAGLLPPLLVPVYQDNK
jgi:hypothetical protein